MSLLSRRSVRNPRLVRLPSSSDQTTSFSDGSSCPNSPAVKKVYRLVVIGTARTGKTAIVNRFLDKDFEERYLPTIENFHRKLYKIRGEVYQLDIIDRSGNDRSNMSKLSYISGDIFLIVSSVDHSQSIEQMIDIRSQIVEIKNARGFNGIIPIVFVINKTDLPKIKWQMSLEEIEEMVKSAIHEINLDSCFISCSAANNENIDKVFSKIFTMGKLPKYMNPELHKMLRNELSADGALTGRKKAMLQRMRSKFSRDNDDEIVIDINARRPSLRTDLLLNRAKTSHLNRTPSLVGTSSSGGVSSSIVARNGSLKNEGRSKKLSSTMSRPAPPPPPPPQQQQQQHTSDANRLIRQVRNNCIIS